MVRATKSSPEARINLGYQFFDKKRFRYRFDLIHEQALPVLVKSLPLGEPEELLSVDDQTCISASTSIDSYRILRMRRPICTKRRI